ncbi:dihydroneopterin aldolase [Pelagibacteraceae bacterium]|jgi:7,8-dihydroneopterin aldolase/epimerase/oxygenase|nr:dihydroneopterin aldolase [Pelagibacteraceae bacterium]MDC1158124.1 dihydroneopterin aldolase [Pelagibacteraceae bacterium]
MKIIKLKLKEKFKYKRRVIIKNLILNIFIGIHNFEKKKKQRVRFNIEVTTNPNIKPNNKDLSTILNYEDLVNKINLLVKKQHHELIEDLAENIFEIIFQNKLVKKTKIKIEKLDIMKNSESVGVEFSKQKI